MTTRWSMLCDLSPAKRELAPEQAEKALAQLCQDYWPPLYRFVRVRGYNWDDAQDLTQGFFAHLLEKGTYQVHDPEKGRFRTFLLVLLKRYLSAEHAYRGRQKRGGGQASLFLDAEQLSAFEKMAENALLTDAPRDEQRAFECDWAAALVGRAMEALKADYASGQKARLLAELRPFLSGGVGLPTHEETAVRLGVPMETLRSHLFRLRSRYRALLREEVARTVPSDGDVESELRYLCSVLLAQD